MARPVAARRGLSTPILLFRHFGSHPGASILLAVVVGLSVLVAALIPRVTAQLAEDELQRDLSSLSPLRADITATAGLDILLSELGNGEPAELFAPFDASLAEAPASVDSPLSEVMGQPQWVAMLDDAIVSPVPAVDRVQTSLSVAFDPSWLDRVRFTEGAAPRPQQGDDPVEIALSTDLAEAMQVEVGGDLGYELYPLRVAGIYEPTDADDPYWVHAPELLEPSETTTLSGLNVVEGVAYADPGSATPLIAGFARGSARAWYPTERTAIDYDSAAVVAAQVDGLVASRIYLAGGGAEMLVSSGLATAIDDVRARIATTSQLIALTGSAPLGVVFAVLAVGVQAVLQRRRDALALASARGAAPWQLRGAMALEGLAIALPASVVGWVIATLVIPVGSPAPDPLTIAVALAVPVLAAALTAPRRLRAERVDLGSRAASTVRIVAELAVVGLAVVALGLLAQRGIEGSAEAGADPLLAATPLLLALAVGAVVLRVYPLPLLALQRGLRARRDAVALVGIARSVRDPSVGFASVLAMVVGTAAAIFAIVLATTISGGLAAAALQQAGADLRVDSRAISPDVIAALEAQPGVESVVTLQAAPNLTFARGRDSDLVTVIFADSAALHALRPDIPELPDAREGAIPFLASEAVAARVSTPESEINETPVTRVGVLSDDAIPDIRDPWVLVDSRAIGQLLDADPPPTSALVGLAPGADSEEIAASLTRLSPSTLTVTTESGVLAAALDRPSTAGLISILWVAALLSLGLGVLTVVLGAVTGAASRNRIIGVLSLLGMPPRELTRTVVWELAPVAVASVAAGTALGLALPWVVTTVVDLSSFVGGSTAVLPVFPVPQLIAAVLGFTASVLLAAVTSVTISRRRDTATTLRIGAE